MATEKISQRIGKSMLATASKRELIALLNALQDDLTALRASLGGILIGSATYDPPSLADAVGTTTTVTVTGAVLGDYAQASFGLDLQGIGVTAYVSAADTVSVRFQNESGGTIDLASSTLRAVVMPTATFRAPAALTFIK